MGKTELNRPVREAKKKRERQAREAKNREQKEREARIRLERRAITTQLKAKREQREALLRAASSGDNSLKQQIRELEREITYLGHALYLLKKTGKSGP